MTNVEDLLSKLEQAMAEEMEFRKSKIKEPVAYQDLEDRKSEPDYKRQIYVLSDLLKPYGLLEQESDIIAIHYFSKPLEDDIFGNGGKMYQRDFKDYKGSYCFHVRLKWNDTKNEELKKFFKDNSSRFFEPIRFEENGNPVIYGDRDEVTFRFYFKWMLRKLKIESI
jgi:hypothetical protein